MGTIATVVIRNKKNGKTRRINENEWAHDLGKGKYDGWERAGGERHGSEDEAARISMKADVTAAQEAVAAETRARSEADAAAAAAAREAEDIAARQRDEEAAAQLAADEGEADEDEDEDEDEDGTDQNEGLI